MTDQAQAPQRKPALTPQSEQFIDPIAPYPEIKPKSINLLLDPSLDKRIDGILQLSKGSFAEIAKNETERIRAYHQATSDFLYYAHCAREVAHSANITEKEYLSIVAQEKLISRNVLRAVCEVALNKGILPEDIQSTIDHIEPLPTLKLSQQRMIEGKSILLSTPVLIRDLFEGQNTDSKYGFGDGKTTQIFAGKAEIGPLQFSAIASPRIHGNKAAGKDGYVLRFAVIKCPGENGVEINHPGFMLDTRVVENLNRWHQSQNPNSFLEENQILAETAEALTPVVHDWFHGWLIYDVNANNNGYVQWGSDIYFDVPHLTDNKLLINYEFLSLWTHLHTWRTIENADPTLKEKGITRIENLLDQYQEFGQWCSENGTDPTTAQEQVEYLTYVLLSNTTMIYDPKEPRMHNMIERYPAVSKKLHKIFDPLFKHLYSDNVGIPSQKENGDLEPIVDYIRRYPLKDEVLARLQSQRRASREQKGIHVSQKYPNMSVESEKAFDALPLSIREQYSESPYDSTSYHLLNDALNEIQNTYQNEDLVTQLASQIELDDKGRMYFRINRDDIDYELFENRERDKRVLLCAVPKGTEIELHSHLSVNLVDNIQKQTTTVSDRDVIAINVESTRDAYILLEAAKDENGDINLDLLIHSARNMHERGMKGADDIYPLLLSKAEELYSFTHSDYYENLGDLRLVANSPGPLIIKLYDGSDQRLIDGVLTYVPPKSGPNKNLDLDPDTHCIEESAFLNSFLKPERDNLSLFQLKKINSFNTENAISKIPHQDITASIHYLLKKLGEINSSITHGDRSNIAYGVFS